MDTLTILGISMIVVAIPGLLAGLALLTGKWAPTIKTAAPDQARRALGLALVSTDTILLVAGCVLTFLRT